MVEQLEPVAEARVAAAPQQWTAVVTRERAATLRNDEVLAAHCQSVGCVVGARVLYQRWPGMILETRVRSEPWLLGGSRGGGTPVISVEGVSGGVALDALYVARAA